jgi:hypothetical protein
MASLLDPRTKSGLGIPPIDKEQIWGEIQDTLICLANANNNNNNNNQRQQRGHNGDEHHAPLNDEAADHYFFGLAIACVDELKKFTME